MSETADFTDSAQSVDALLASAKAPGMGEAATAIRLFGFRAEGTQERLALVFVGPEAAVLSKMFVQYAEELFQYIESRATPAPQETTNGH